MRQMGVIAALAFAALAGSPALAPGAAASVSSVAVPVVRCATQFGVTGPHPPTPLTLTVDASPAPVGALAAYSNTDGFLLGPRNMRCGGLVAVDGGSQIVVWRAGHARPGLHADTDGLTLSLDPACASCRAQDACPFFPQFARSLGFPCTSGIPAGERVNRLGADTALFEDPPGVAGSGWPSGGSDPANGVVGIVGSSDEDQLVYRATCTLPAPEHSLCTSSLNDVIRRYG